MNAVQRKCTFSVKKRNTAQVVFTTLRSPLFSHIFIRSLNARTPAQNGNGKVSVLDFPFKTSLSVNMLLMKTTASRQGIVVLSFTEVIYNLFFLTFSRRTVTTGRRFSCSSQCGSLGTELWSGVKIVFDENSCQKRQFYVTQKNICEETGYSLLSSCHFSDMWMTFCATPIWYPSWLSDSRDKKTEMQKLI